MPKAATPIYQLKVTLKDSRPPIWRRLLVHQDSTLADLHDIIQIAMGWEDYHLHMFRKGGEIYEPFDNELPDMRDMLGQESHDESRIPLHQVLSRVKSKISYVYDFGDDWEHEILLEAKLPQEEGHQYPVCIKGRRACPPEDCGGIWGYENLLHALQHPDNPEYEELLEWLPEGFDPKTFDLVAVNNKLAR
jgi:hypothetical protein